MPRLGFRKAICEAKDQEGRRGCLLGAMIFPVISIMLVSYMLFWYYVVLEFTLWNFPSC